MSAAAIKDLQRDWVTGWPRYWPDKSFAYRCGFQAGINKALGADAVHIHEHPSHNPHTPGTADAESWDVGQLDGRHHANGVLATQRAKEAARAQP